MINKKYTDDEFRKDFEDSVLCEELNADSIPAELMAEFELSMGSHKPKSTPDDLLDISFDDIIITN